MGTDEEGRPLDAGLSECPPPCEFRRDAIDDPNSELTNKIIYFEFNDSNVKQEDLDLIASHGRYLSVYGGMAVRLEGHTDERGSREYNVGLGEQRSDAVRQQLLLQGVAADQITTISYGEELPANPDHDEEAWRQNRRVELVYENR
jgi:peptidoglycan-associated lipoprotein